MAAFLQEVVEALQARAADDAVVADVLVLLPQVLEQGDLQFVLRSKRSVAALGGRRPVPLPVPEKNRLAQARSRRDERGVSRARPALAQGGEVLRAQRRQALPPRL